MMLATAWFFLKRMPRIFILILLFISIFLLAFLLLGCSTESSVYSSIYLIRYSFNESSPIYSLIKKSFTSKNLTGYEEMEVFAGYLALCISVDDDKSCTSRSELSSSSYSSSTSVSVYTVNSNSSSTTLDLLSLGSDFSNDIVHPYVLIATIILTIILFLTVLYAVIPGLPVKHIITKFNLVLAPILALIWGLGAMWSHVAADAGESLVESASMGIVQAHVGSKASALTWTPFTFLCMVAVGIVALYLRDMHRALDAVDPKV